MPEGPEVRREADRIARALSDTQVEEAWFAFPELQPEAQLLSAQTVSAVESRGKAMLVRFARGLNIYSHNQLYGRWYVTARGKTPRTGRSLRLALHTKKHSALLYSASEIEVLEDAQLLTHPYLKKLGPDVLNQRTQVGDVAERLADKRFMRRSLGALLLDQGFVSGLGNYLRSEILFVTHLDADLRPSDLDDGQRQDLAHAIIMLTRRSYRLRGITNDPDRVRDLKLEGVPRHQYRHYVFSQANRPCPQCGVKIEKRYSAGRRLYFCPACQSR